MALTFTNVTRNKGDNVWIVQGLIAFDSSYPTGGEQIKASDLGLNVMETLMVENSDGYVIDADLATGGATAQVLVYAVGSAAHTHTVGTITAAINPTVDEVKSVTPATGVAAALTNIPVGNIMSVYSTAGTYTGPLTLIPAAATLATGQCKYNLTTGVITCLVADAITSITVTYQRAANTMAGATASTTPAGAGAEVANGTNLSSITNVQFIAIGV